MTRRCTAQLPLAWPEAVEPKPPRTADTPLRAIGADERGIEPYEPPTGTPEPMPGAFQ
jgi:hypothetical protein